MTKAAQRELQQKRRDALEAAYPEWSNQTISHELHRFTKGKASPTQTKVRRVFAKAGLL